MATLTVFNESGGEVGTYEIDTEQIAASVNKQLLHDAVVSEVLARASPGWSSCGEQGLSGTASAC